MSKVKILEPLIYMIIISKKVIRVICFLFNNTIPWSRNSACNFYPLKVSFFTQFTTFFQNIPVYKEIVGIVKLWNSIFVLNRKFYQMNRFYVHLNILIIPSVLRKDTRWYVWFLRKISFPVKQNISVVMYIIYHVQNISVVIWKRFNISFKCQIRMKSKGISKGIFN